MVLFVVVWFCLVLVGFCLVGFSLVGWGVWFGFGVCLLRVFSPP